MVGDLIIRRQHNNYNIISQVACPKQHIAQETNIYTLLNTSTCTHSYCYLHRPHKSIYYKKQTQVEQLSIYNNELHTLGYLTH